MGGEQAVFPVAGNPAIPGAGVALDREGGASGCVNGGIAAATAFFRKALKHHREPHSITLDGHQPSHSALRRMGMNGEFNFRGRKPLTIRCCQYLNNVVEQDHRRVKGRLQPMLGFKTFYNARRVIIGIELAQKIHKRQFAIPIPWQSNPAVIWRHVMAA